MAVSLIMRVDEPKLEAIYSWLQGRGGAVIQLFGWEAGKKAALLAYSDGAQDAFGWSNWLTRIADDPSTLLALFDQLEVVVDEATAPALNATFLGAFRTTPQPG